VRTQNFIVTPSSLQPIKLAAHQAHSLRSYLRTNNMHLSIVLRCVFLKKLSRCIILVLLILLEGKLSIHAVRLALAKVSIDKLQGLRTAFSGL
jgi:hypothetical protein